MAGNFEIVCLLAENGADVNQVDCSEQTPLIYCFSRLNEDENYYETTEGVRIQELDRKVGWKNAALSLAPCAGLGRGG